MQLSAWGRWPRLGKARPGIRFNEHIEGDGPTVFAHACKMGLEGQRVEAQGLRLSFRPFAGLVEDEESERSSGEARGGGGLGRQRAEMTQSRYSRGGL